MLRYLAPCLPLVALAACGSLVTGPVTSDDGDSGLAADTDDGNGGGGGNGGGKGGGKGGGNGGGGDQDGDGGGPVPSGDVPMIVEAFDGKEHAAVRYVEIYNPTGKAVDLTGWGLNVTHDGADTLTVKFPAITIAPGGSVIVCHEDGADEFEDLFGFPCDVRSKRVGDGNDPMVLIDASNRPVDQYGERRTDGTGKPWDYTDGVAKRKAGKQAYYGFDVNDWNITKGEGAANPGNRH